MRLSAITTSSLPHNVGYRDFWLTSFNNIKIRGFDAAVPSLHAPACEVHVTASSQLVRRVDVADLDIGTHHSGG